MSPSELSCCSGKLNEFTDHFFDDPFVILSVTISVYTSGSKGNREILTSRLCSEELKEQILKVERTGHSVRNF